MADIFTLQTVPMTSEIGMALKNFRIEHEITATSIVNDFEKSPTYITKLEKGDIKKIETDFLIALCNYITKSEDGLRKFLSKVARNYLEYSEETKLILRNIDNLIIEHPITSSFIEEVAIYMNEHNIDIEQLAEKINANEDLKDLNQPLSNFEANILLDSDSSNYSHFIKLEIPTTYLKDLLSNKITKIHYIIAEGILYSLYRLGNEKDARSFANSKLRVNNIIPYIGSTVIEINDENMDRFFGGLQPEASDALQGIASGLKLIVNLTKKDDYGLKHIQQIESNLKSDLGFTFAYMSIDLEKLIIKSKQSKQNFLYELRELVEKYSQDETGLDLYE